MSSLKYLWCAFMSHQFMWLFETHIFFFFLNIYVWQKVVRCTSSLEMLYLMLKKRYELFNICRIHSDEKCKCNRKFGNPQLLWGETFFFFSFHTKFIISSAGLRVWRWTKGLDHNHITHFLYHAVFTLISNSSVQMLFNTNDSCGNDF